MAERKRHPNKEIEEALRYAEAEKWTIKKASKSAHAWGVMRCPFNDAECRCGQFCQRSIWSTPRVPEDHPELVRRLRQQREDELRSKEKRP